MAEHDQNVSVAALRQRQSQDTKNGHFEDLQEFYDYIMENHEERMLLPDDSGRRNGSIFMTNRVYNMSKIEYPLGSPSEQVDDSLSMKQHLGEDAHGTCIHAVECHITYQRRGERRGDWETHHAYHGICQEFMKLKYKRMSVAGVFMDEGKDRITITRTSIAMGERYPFMAGESRSNGFQWYVA
ncbi:hypothetical protein AC1031_009215 [Aphanomyces cochlioides]|nr:hypothetical protein AC1031_009215 [Aphanomyces cochlioides]